MAEAHKAAKTSCLITWSLVKELIAFLTVQFGDEIDWEFSRSRSMKVSEKMALLQVLLGNRSP